mmetsp:Transcript_21514/g.54199  ORF Transcript_21514/g.54199 Transcript_21514/m.54199 type:complete len:223 (+) Transcript_21514:1791-2459(+)
MRARKTRTRAFLPRRGRVPRRSPCPSGCACRAARCGRCPGNSFRICTSGTSPLSLSVHPAAEMHPALSSARATLCPDQTRTALPCARTSLPRAAPAARRARSGRSLRYRRGRSSPREKDAPAARLLPPGPATRTPCRNLTTRRSRSTWKNRRNATNRCRSIPASRRKHRRRAVAPRLSLLCTRAPAGALRRGLADAAPASSPSTPNLPSSRQTPRRRTTRRS